MGGFNYGGGKGDGTGWSSERGSGPEPGGGSQGNAGHSSNNGSSTKNDFAQRQLNSVRNDPAIRNMLADLLKRTRSISPHARVTLTKLDKDGVLSVMVSGISRDQIAKVEKAFKAVNPAIKSDPLAAAYTSTTALIFGSVATGHILDNYHRTPTGNGGGNDTKAENSVKLATYSSVLSGEIPQGFWLDNEKVMTQVMEKYTISGGGKGNDRTKYRKSHVEVPSLTDAWKQWNKIQNDVAQEEARRKAEEEQTKSQQAEWDVLHPEAAAQRQIDEARQRINKAQQDKNNAQNALNDKESVVKKAGERLKMAEEQKEEFITENPPHEWGKGWSEQVGSLDRDIGNKRNELSSALGELNTGRDALNQSQQRLEQSQHDFSNAESRLNTLRAERKSREDAEAIAAAEAAEKENDAKETLIKTSALVADAGEKVGKYLGESYREVARKIADNIRNFQGKKLRSFDDAMASLNKITSNPAMKINKGDKDAIINAWKHINANDMANRLGHLGRAFKAADVAVKFEKVREKSITGYETGDWKPLMLEVESWVLSGMAASIALGMLASLVSTHLLASYFITTAVTIIGIMLISYLSSWIDDKLADEINNKVIQSLSL